MSHDITARRAKIREDIYHCLEAKIRKDITAWKQRSWRIKIHERFREGMGHTFGG